MKEFWAMLGSAPLAMQCVFVFLGFAVMVIFLDALRPRRIK
jgi:hypothetical protein